MAIYALSVHEFAPETTVPKGETHPNALLARLDRRHVPKARELYTGDEFNSNELTLQADGPAKERNVRW